jgi:hypothetical protein
MTGALLLASAIVPVAHAAHDHGTRALTFFLSGEAISRGANQQPGLQDTTDSDLVADMIVGLHHERWRLLAEYVIGPADHELERLQVGYEPGDNTVVWIGRYHQPASVWNVVYHHGRYLQTSITKPWIENWEDDAGILAQHIVGAEVESQFSLGGNSGWRVSAGAGLAPRFEGRELMAVAPLTGTYRGAGTHGSLRLEWLPDQTGEESIGLLASRSQVPVVMPAGATSFGSRLDFTLVGGFASLGSSRLKALAAVYGLRIAAQGPGAGIRDEHLAGYLQLDYAARPDTTVFARHENMSHTNSAYLAQFPRAIVRRSLLGLRWQLGDSNALSGELGRDTPELGNSFTEVRVQWSAVLP